MVLWHFLDFAVRGNVHYIWHWMVLSVVLPNVDTSVKKLSTLSTIIWSRKIKVFVLQFCFRGPLFHPSGWEFSKFFVLQLINNIACLKAKLKKQTLKKPHIYRYCLSS